MLEYFNAEKSKEDLSEVEAVEAKVEGVVEVAVGVVVAMPKCSYLVNQLFLHSLLLSSYCPNAHPKQRLMRSIASVRNRLRHLEYQWWQLPVYCVHVYIEKVNFTSCVFGQRYNVNEYYDYTIQVLLLTSCMLYIKYIAQIHDTLILVHIYPNPRLHANIRYVHRAYTF